MNLSRTWNKYQKIKSSQKTTNVETYSFVNLFMIFISLNLVNCASGWTWTNDSLINSQVLWPTELLKRVETTCYRRASCLANVRYSPVSLTTVGIIGRPDQIEVYENKNKEGVCVSNVRLPSEPKSFINYIPLYLFFLICCQILLIIIEPTVLPTIQTGNLQEKNWFSIAI